MDKGTIVDVPEALQQLCYKHKSGLQTKLSWTVIK